MHKKTWGIYRSTSLLYSRDRSQEYPAWVYKSISLNQGHTKLIIWNDISHKAAALSAIEFMNSFLGEGLLTEPGSRPQVSLTQPDRNTCGRFYVRVRKPDTSGINAIQDHRVRYLHDHRSFSVPICQDQAHRAVHLD